MRKDKLPLYKPWSYRSKLSWMFLIGCLLATILSFTFSYLSTSRSLRQDVADNQVDSATKLRMLAEQSELSIEDILQIVLEDEMVASLVSSDDLTEAQTETLTQEGCLCLAGDYDTLPVTYVLVRGEIYSITHASRASFAKMAFYRIAGTFAIIGCIFALVSIYSASRAAQPITELTKALQQITDGDYSVRLPEDSRSQIGSMMHQFNEMADALARTDTIQKDFVANISHEFKTPIAAIKGYTRLLETPGLSDDDRAEYVSVINVQASRLQNIAQTLLRLASLEQHGRAPAQLSTFRLDEQIRQVIVQLSALWSPKEIEWDLDLRELTVNSDEALLAQVWTNIIQNAIKFSGSGQTIRISCYDAGAAVVAIEDHGIGMDEQTRRRFFDRFYQADHSRSQDGVGLGMTLTKRILDILGSTIRVDSKLGEGSCFTVTVPFDYREDKE